MLTLRVTADISLDEPTVDSGFVTWLDIDILAQDHDAETETEVGAAQVALIHVGETCNLGQSLAEVLDADSADLEALFDVYFEDGWLKEEFADAVGANVLYVDDISLQTSWQGRNVEMAVVRRLSDTVGDGCALAVVPYRSDEEAEPWVRMGFGVTRPPSRDRCGYLTLQLALRSARVVEDGARFRVIPNPLPKEKRKHH